MRQAPAKTTRRSTAKWTHKDVKLTPMEIESKFAAVVASARGVTRLADAAGIEQRVCEVIVHALCDLWDEGTAAGLSPSEIEAIARSVLGMGRRQRSTADTY